LKRLLFYNLQKQKRDKERNALFEEAFLSKIID